jgi:predicted alpha/beta superfamily hydrolase|tara:strand:+ start:357 stop:1748 length:1392 start_codon:yes stop_codon:yes gene_type:complete
MNKIFTFLILFISISLSGQSETKDTLQYTYKVEKFKSAFFKKERTVKVYLPKNYDKKHKYPVIYTLDGYELFEITTNYENYLAKFNIIPNSIVVGIYHNNRNYETTPNYGSDVRIPVTEFLEGSEKLKNHLLKEVIPIIDNQYSTSGFNTLVGHSNTATFVNEMITENENPFNGFIAITPDLLEEQTEHLKKYLYEKEFNKTYYFVSSGLKDDKYRLETGKILDTIFRKTKNKNFTGLHKIYNAGHLDLVPKSLNDALMFIFSDFRNYDDFNIQVIEKNLPILTYIERKTISTNENYGINYNLIKDDFYYLLDLVLKKKDKNLLEQIFEVGEKNEFFTKNDKYSSKAQFYEEMRLYQDALKNWKLQIENGFYESTFYFERPFKLLTKNLNRPKEGIDFLEKAIKKYPKGKLTFSYLIAETTLKYRLNKRTGIRAINYCLDHFDENRKFNLKDAKELKLKLLKK